jgi:hypothetical protein
MDHKDIIGKTFKFDMDMAKARYGLSPTASFSADTDVNTTISTPLKDTVLTVNSHDPDSARFICTLIAPAAYKGQDFSFSDHFVKEYINKQLLIPATSSNGFYRHGYGESGFEWL